MVTYSSLDDEFGEIKGRTERCDGFGRMTYEEFNEFFGYVFVNRLSAILENRESVSPAYLLLRLPMMAALCSKVFEVAHFCDGVPEDWREAPII